MVEQELYDAIKAVSNTVKNLTDLVASTGDALVSIDERIKKLEDYVFGDGGDVKDVREVQNVSLRYTMENMKTINGNTEHILDLSSNVTKIMEHLVTVDERLRSL